MNRCLTLAALGALAASLAASAQTSQPAPGAAQIAIAADDIGGVVTSGE